MSRVVLQRWREALELRGGPGAQTLLVVDGQGRPAVARRLTAATLAALSVERAEAEADQAAGLSHANIARVQGFGVDRGDFVVVRDFVAGEALRKLFDRHVQPSASRPMPFGVAVEIGVGLSVALTVAHRKGVVHGALSPWRVRLGPDGQVTVVDFGMAAALARLRQADAASPELGYLSPEHCLNEPLTPASDVYALGIVLWEMLTGKRLYGGLDAFDAMQAICEQETPPPSKINAAVPPLIDSLILKALAKQPAQRFESAEKLARSLHKLHQRQSAKGAESLAGFLDQSFGDRITGWKRARRAADAGDIDQLVELLGRLEGIEAGAAAATAEMGSDGPTVSMERPGFTRTGGPGRTPDAGPNETTAVTRSPFEDDEPTAVEAQHLDAEETLEREAPGVDDSRYDVEPTTLIGQDGRAQGFGAEPSEAAEADGPGRDSAGRGSGGGDFFGVDDADFDDLWDGLDQGGADTASTHLGKPGGQELSGPAGGGPDAHSTQMGKPGGLDAHAPAGGFEHHSLDALSEALSHASEATDGAVESGGDAAAAIGPSTDGDIDDFSQEATRPTASGVVAETDHDGTVEQTTEFEAADEPTGPIGGAAAPAAQAPASQPSFEPGFEPQAATPRATPRSAVRHERSGAAGGDDPFAVDYDAWIDDEDDDELFVEPFSIDEIIGQEASIPRGGDRVDSSALEVLRLGPNGSVLESTVLRGLKRRHRTPDKRLVATLGFRSATVKWEAPVTGWIKRYADDTDTKQPLDGSKIELEIGDVAEFHGEEMTYRVRSFHPIKAPELEQNFTRRDVRVYSVAFLLSVGLHLAAIAVVIGISAMGVIAMTVGDKPKAEVFAEGTLEKPDKPEDKPEPNKPEPPKPKPRPPVTDPTEQPTRIPKAVKKELTKRLEKRRAAVEEADTKADAMMAALKSPVAGDGQTVDDVVSNIDAVKGKAGNTSSAFRVAGTLKALENGGKVNVATGGGGELSDKLSGKVADGVGKLDKRKKTGKVRGKVTTIGALAKQKGGTLSRSEVLKVINRHQGQIQGCYERELLHNSGLAGKATFEWTVKLNGRVSNAREISSTLGSTKVSKCIQGVIRKMKFPKPKGGEAIIRFPFMFRSG